MITYRSRDVKRVRLDTLLSERGDFPSRSRAAASVLAGEVLLLPERRRAEKPGQLVPADVAVEVRAGAAFVSRGGVKLANALDALGLDVRGVRALDVGYGELDWRLRGDSRVTVIERRNARSLSPEELRYRPEVIVIDVSFISLRKMLPAALACAAERFDCLALIKPQFEVGRALVGKGGVVRDAEARRGALVSVGQFAASGLGASVLGYASSGLPGPKGNLETFVWLAEGGREGVSDIAAAAREVEP